MIRFSILTPSYQQAAFIERTLASVRAQNWPAVQHIVMDGGSSDGTREILERQGAALGTWVSEPDRGQAHALNKAFALADGDVVGWINSDDTYLPGAFAAVARQFEAHPELDACYGGLAVIDADDRVLDVYRAPELMPRYTVGVALDVHQQALFVRRRTWAALQGVDEGLQFAMDYDFICRLVLRHRVGRVDRVLGALRRHEATKTSNIKHVGSRELLVVRERYASELRFGLPGAVERRLLRARHLARSLGHGGARYLAFKLAARRGLALTTLLGLPSRLSYG